MPLPTPNKGERQSDFVSRCVSMLANKGEGKDNKQRTAVCYSQFQRGKAADVRAAFEAVAMCGMDHSKMKSGEKCEECGYEHA